MAAAAQVTTATGPAYAVDPAWTRRTAAGEGIPEPAMGAYGTATIRIGRRALGTRRRTTAVLPSMWDTWGSDGGGDGQAEPQDLDDAAWSAARYLCASGLDLSTGAGWAPAVRSDNHSDTCVRAVYDAASADAARTK